VYDMDRYFKLLRSCGAPTDVRRQWQLRRLCRVLAFCSLVWSLRFEDPRKKPLDHISHLAHRISRSSIGITLYFLFFPLVSSGETCVLLKPSSALGRVSTRQSSGTTCQLGASLVGKQGLLGTLVREGSTVQNQMNLTKMTAAVGCTMGKRGA
jgi:hypothetical protein